jgi:hypothetical protein
MRNRIAGTRWSRSSSRWRRRTWGVVAAATGVFALPALAPGLHKGANQISWIGPPRLHDLREIPVALAGGSSLALTILLAAGCYGLARAWRRPKRWRHGFALAWFSIPICASYLVSLRQPMFVDKYLIVVLPALGVFAAGALSFPSRREWIALLLLLVLGTSLVGLRNLYRTPIAEDWRDASHHVLSTAVPTDAIVFFPDYARFPFEYYRSLAGRQSPATLTSDQAVTSGAARIWAAFRTTDAPRYQSLADAFATSIGVRYRLAQDYSYGTIDVLLYVRSRT